MHRLYLVLLFIFICNININCGLDVNNKNLDIYFFNYTKILKQLDDMGQSK